MNTEYQLSLINIHCVTNGTDVTILTFPVFETSCWLHVFMTDAENSMRSHINNISFVGSLFICPYFQIAVCSVDSTCFATFFLLRRLYLFATLVCFFFFPLLFYSFSFS